MITMNTILVPTDCSELSKDAIEYAIRFAKQFKARLKLLMVTVSEPLTVLNDYGYFSPELHQKIVLEADRRAEAELKQFWAENADPEVDAELINLKGDPFTEIIRYARENEIDLIVMATHGRTGLKHVIMGSVAEKVVRYSPHPVLTIKNKDYEFSMEAL
jgi:nucleotide-binding universal stress UspA family protein